MAIVTEPVDPRFRPANSRFHSWLLCYDILHIIAACVKQSSWLCIVLVTS